MAHSTFFWGIPKTWRYSAAVRATSWKRVSARKKRAIEKDLDRLAGRVKETHGQLAPPLKTRLFFEMMRIAQKHGWNEADAVYWEKKGWTGKNRPWKA